MSAIMTNTNSESTNKEDFFERNVRVRAQGRQTLLEVARVPLVVTLSYTGLSDCPG